MLLARLARADSYEPSVAHHFYPVAAAGLTTTLTVLAPAAEVMTSSGASGAETTCPPVTLT